MKVTKTEPKDNQHHWWLAECDKDHVRNPAYWNLVYCDGTSGRVGLFVGPVVVPDLALGIDLPKWESAPDWATHWGPDTCHEGKDKPGGWWCEAWYRIVPGEEVYGARVGQEGHTFGPTCHKDWPERKLSLEERPK